MHTLGIKFIISREFSDKKWKGHKANLAVARFYFFSEHRFAACLENQDRRRPWTAFFIFQIDGNKSKMRDAPILFSPMCVRNRAYGVWVCVCVKTHPAYMCIYIYAHICTTAYNSRCIRLQSSVSSPDFTACKNSVVVAVSTWTSLSPSPVSSFSSVVGIVVLVGVLADWLE